MDIEDPEQLLEIFENTIWYNKEGIIEDITEKLKEFGYSTVGASEHASDSEHYIKFLCKHGVVLGHIWIFEDEDGGYIFYVLDCDIDYSDLNECQLCKKVKTIKICNEDKFENGNRIILDKETVEEIIKLIESEKYTIANGGIVISDEEGIIITLKEILKGKNEDYKVI